jgi:hypothetical protein
MSMSSGRSSKGKSRLPTLSEIMPSPATEVRRDFDPCAATASMFLYAQGNSVVCAHHDTLTIERRFSRHTEEIQLLAVDTVSERGAGRLVVSYDVGQTAIVWDCMTGDELARFASYENLTVAAWMRNGNVAFGKMKNPSDSLIAKAVYRKCPRERDFVRADNLRAYFCENDRSNTNYRPSTGSGL